jgi:protein SCO1/2
MKGLLILLLALAAGWAARAEDPGFRQFPGALLPGVVALSDETGVPARFETMMSGKRPAILALIYFHCPALCGVELADLFKALGQTKLQAGRDYDLFAISIDPRDGSRDAMEARAAYLRRFPLPGAEEGWHFLTGDPEALYAVEHAVGFTARYEPALGQYIHPAGVVLLTPKRRVSSYLLGIGYDGGELRQRLRDAGEGKIAPTGNPILLLCFHFDPASGRYSLDVYNTLKVAALLTVVGLGGTLFLAFRRGRGP